MNKYELALVVSANVEDEVRNATVEQVKELITRFGGTITDPGTARRRACIRNPAYERRILQLH